MDRIELHFLVAEELRKMTAIARDVFPFANDVRVHMRFVDGDKTQFQVEIPYSGSQWDISVDLVTRGTILAGYVRQLAPEASGGLARLAEEDGQWSGTVEPTYE